MEVTVLGGGNVALASTAMLATRGHTVRLWSACADEVAALAGGIDARGVIETQIAICPHVEIDRALAGSDVAVLCLPAFAHATVMEQVAIHLPRGVPVIVHPATGLTTLLLDRRLRERGHEPLLIDLSTSLAACRRIGAERVRILSIKHEIDLATLPASRLGDGHEVCRALFGDRFAPVSSILSVALNNHNPIYHLPPFLANLTRIERGEEWIVWEMMTPAVIRLIEAIDAERMAVAKAHEVEAITLAEYLARSYGVQHTSLVEAYRELNNMLRGPLGPQALDHRFLTEDATYALALFAHLGQGAGVSMPSTDAFVHLAGLLMEAAGHRPRSLLHDLGLDGRTPAGIAELCRVGHA